MNTFFIFFSIRILRLLSSNSISDKRSIPGITPKVLAKELKDLEQHQLIKRVVVDDYPVMILYKPEPYADTLTTIIEALKNWGLNHRKRIFEKE